MNFSEPNGDTKGPKGCRLLHSRTLGECSQRAEAFSWFTPIVDLAFQRDKVLRRLLFVGALGLCP